METDYNFIFTIVEEALEYSNADKDRYITAAINSVRALV